MQADGVRIGMEAHRRAMPFCMGSLYWQIDDCWPVASWSSIDYFGRWKALHYTARTCFAAVLVSPVTKDDETQFYIVSDRLQPFDATLEIRVLDFDGNEISRVAVPVRVPANCSTCGATLAKQQLTKNGDDSHLVMVSRLKEDHRVVAESLRCFRLPKDLKLSPPALAMRIQKLDRGYSIELSCRSFARSVMLSCGDDAGFFSDNYFDLLPGDKRVVDYRTSLDEKSVRRQLKATSLVDSCR
jgi:beta-mannosidase